ncbi:hypothetical protein V6574_00875 [Streptomyces sp. SM1P]
MARPTRGVRSSTCDGGHQSAIRSVNVSKQRSGDAATTTDFLTSGICWSPMVPPT